MTMSPTAIGIEVAAPILNRFKNGTTLGTSDPNATPIAMAEKIQAVR